MSTTDTYLSNMACLNRVVSWTTPCACTELTVTLSYRHTYMTLPHLPLWRQEQMTSVWRFSFNCSCVISVPNSAVNDLYHDSIGNKLLGFVFYRSDEPIVICVCGMRSADQDHRIVSEPIASGSFLESDPGGQRTQHTDEYQTYSGMYCKSMACI